MQSSSNSGTSEIEFGGEVWQEDIVGEDRLELKFKECESCIEYTWGRMPAGGLAGTQTGGIPRGDGSWQWMSMPRWSPEPPNSEVMAKTARFAVDEDARKVKFEVCQCVGTVGVA